MNRLPLFLYILAALTVGCSDPAKNELASAKIALVDAQQKLDELIDRNSPVITGANARYAFDNNTLRCLEWMAADGTAPSKRTEEDNLLLDIVQMKAALLYDSDPGPVRDLYRQTAEGKRFLVVWDGRDAAKAKVEQLRSLVYGD